MNVCKMLVCDINEGILKNKRYVIVPFLAFLECLYANINICALKSYREVTQNSNIIELIAEIFHGCDPIAQNTNPDIKIAIPYLWFAIFVFAVFISFDYMHNDLTQFGIQILSRSKKRADWWFSKCLWSVLSSIWFYFLFFLTIILFGAANEYSIIPSSNPESLNIIADQSIMYSFIGITKASGIVHLKLFLLPLLVIITLNMIQMFLTLFIKPMHAYLIIVGLLTVGILTDMPIAISRLSMVTFSKIFYENGYNEETGLIICCIFIISTIIGGSLLFKRYDILPDRE
jgi:hypothetical protein